MSSDEEDNAEENFHCAHIITVIFPGSIMFFINILFLNKRRVINKQFMELVYVNKLYQMKVKTHFYLLLVL